MVGFLPVPNGEIQEHYVTDDVKSPQGCPSGSSVEVKAYVPLASDASGRFRKT